MTITNKLGFDWAQQTPIERVTSGVPVVDTNHAQIHAGNAFSMVGTLAVDTGEVGAIQIYVPGEDYATLTIDMTNATSDLTYTAVDYGVAGNSITVTHTDPSGNNQALAVTVVGTAIDISLATGAGGAITSTAALVKAAVNSHAEASLLVTCEDEGAGTGIVNAEAETALAGGASPAYIHFQALQFTSDSGPATVALLEDYVMDPTSLAAADTVTPRNHHRATGGASVLTVLSHAGDVTATDDGDNITLASLALNGASVGANKVSANNGQSEEWVLATQTNYLVTFTNGDSGTINFNYNLFWYEEDGY